MAVSKGRPIPSLFNTLDESFHATLRRCVNAAFSMSALVQYEPMIDETTELFLSQTQRIYASTGKVCDLSKWLQFYAFDVIGSITYSKRHGFLERNEDVDGITKWLEGMFSYAGPVCNISTSKESMLIMFSIGRSNAVAGQSLHEKSPASHSRQVWSN